MKEKFLIFNIIPIKTKMDYNDYPKRKILGFWGFIFKIFNINVYKPGISYSYTGNYFKGIYQYYRLRKKFKYCSLLQFKVK
jgi:hypothetical protein